MKNTPFARNLAFAALSACAPATATGVDAVSVSSAAPAMTEENLRACARIQRDICEGVVDGVEIVCRWSNPGRGFDLVRCEAKPDNEAEPGNEAK